MQDKSASYNNSRVTVFGGSLPLWYTRDVLGFVLVSCVGAATSKHGNPLSHKNRALLKPARFFVASQPLTKHLLQKSQRLIPMRHEIIQVMRRDPKISMIEGIHHGARIRLHLIAHESRSMPEGVRR